MDGGDDDVRGVDGQALGAVGGDGVAEVDVLGDVVGGQHDAGPESSAGAAHLDGPVAADVDDRPAVAVADPAAAPGAQRAVVAAGDDEVAGAGAGVVGQGDVAAGRGFPGRGCVRRGRAR